MKCKRPNCSLRAKPNGHQGLCSKHYDALKEDRGLVDSAACKAHVAALRAAGHSWRGLAKITGIDRSTLAHLGEWTPNSKVEANTHLSIMRVPYPTELVDGGAGNVPNVGTKRRIQALMALGWSKEFIASEFGVSQQCVGQWQHRRSVSSATAVKVRDLFNRLQMTPGPSKRSITWAKRQGFPPPLAWDEESIDDPNAQPLMGEENPMGWYEDYLELKELGLDIGQIAERLGLLRESLRQKLMRLNGG